MSDINNTVVVDLTLDTIGWVACAHGWIWVEELENEQLYQAYVEYDDDDEDNIILLLSRAAGLETELYDDEHATYGGTQTEEINDRLAQVIEIQGRMETGMCMIQEQTIVRDMLRVEYQTMKDRISSGWDIINTTTDYTRKGQLRTYMAKVVDEKNKIGSTLGAANDRLSYLWDHWKLLAAQCKDIVGDHKAVWPKYFELDDEDEWISCYLNDEIYVQDQFYQDNPTVDNRMLVSHQAYFLADKEENFYQI